MEREAKYRITKPVKAKRIEALDLAPYALDARITHDLRDTVLDTAGRALARGRHTLRVRRDGGQTLLTLKAPGQVDGAIHSREEIEVPIAAELRDTPERWPEPIAGPLRALVGDEPLAPLFQVRNRRRSWNVLRDGRRVAEIALDRGRIEAGGRHVAFHELEIELKDDGGDEDLAAIVDRLLAALPLEPEPASKSARGMALLRDESERADQQLKEAAGRVPMQPGAVLAEAGRAILARHLRKLHDSLPVIRAGDDPEGAHQLRVATRRMRAVLGALSGVAYDPALVRRLRRSLKGLASAGGLVRDPEVMLEAADAYAAGLEPGPAAQLEPLREELRQRRAAGRAELFELLDSKKTARFLRRLGEFVASEGAGLAEAEEAAGACQPRLVRHLAGGLLWRQYERVRAYEPALAGAPIETLHRLRIEIKYLRYLVELFQDALDEEAGSLHKLLVAAQDHLGAMQDAEVAVALADELLLRQPDNPILHEYRRQAAAIRDTRAAGASLAAGPLMQLPFRRRLASLISKL